MPDADAAKPDRRRPGGGAARALCCAVVAFVVVAGIIALVLYLVYRPSRPRFSVTGAAIYALGTNTNNITGYPANAPAVAATVQFTLLLRNPNERSAVLYDRLSAYVSYRDEPVTPPTPLPPLIQDSDSSVAVSPVLGGGVVVPVSADVAAALATDEAYGVVALRLVVLGRARFKSGPFHSGWYGLYVRCDILVGVRKGIAGQVPLLGNPDCHVDM